MSDNFIIIDYNTHLNLNRDYSVIRYIMNKPSITSRDMEEVWGLLENIDEILPEADTEDETPYMPISNDFIPVIRTLINDIITLLSNHPSQPVNITRLSYIHENIVNHIPNIDELDEITDEEEMTSEPEPSVLSNLTASDITEEDPEDIMMPRLSIADLMSDFDMEVILPTISEKTDSIENYHKDGCSICMEESVDMTKQMYVTRCDHSYCQSCFKSWEHTCRSNYRETSCPMCRVRVTHVTIYR